jgi:hypothetical protein
MTEEPRMKIADLDEASLAKVQALEADIGACVVALEREVEFFDLSEAELKKLQKAENELGLVLMAYKCT